MYTQPIEEGALISYMDHFYDKRRYGKVVSSSAAWYHTQSFGPDALSVIRDWQGVVAIWRNHNQEPYLGWIPLNDVVIESRGKPRRNLPSWF